MVVQYLRVIQLATVQTVMYTLHDRFAHEDLQFKLTYSAPMQATKTNIALDRAWPAVSVEELLA